MQTNFEEMTWEFANEIAVEEIKRKPLSVGAHHLHIDKAMYNPDTKVFYITFRSLDNDESSEFRYYMMKKDGSKNNMAIHTMNSLKAALTGKGDGCLLPNQIENGVVIAEVKLGKPFTNDKGETVQYTQILDFEPVTVDYFDMVAMSENVIPDQYKLTDDGGQ